MRKLTHEEQVAAIAKVNPDIEVLREITGDKTKVLCRCKVCGHEWLARPGSLKRGIGCPKCGELKRAQSNTLSHKEQIAAITKVNHDLEVLGEIINSKTKVLCRCKVCDHKWMAIPPSIKRGHGCPKCGYLKTARKNALSHEEQVAVIAKVNPNIELLGEIINDNTKVLCRCKVCDHEWSVRPADLKRGSGCQKCGYLKVAQKLRLSHEEQVAAIAKVNPDIEVLGKIKKDKTKISCRCKVCDHKWSATPVDLKRGHGCPKCGRLKAGQNRALSHEEQVTAIAEVNPDVEVLGKITGNQKKVLCRCKVCDHKWSVTPRKLKFDGSGCPKCKAQKQALSNEKCIAAIAKVNPNVEVFGEMINLTTKVLCRCKVCDHKWMATPHHLKDGRGCPKCAKYGFLSHEHGKLYIMADDLVVPTIMKIGVSVKENERRNQVLRSAHKAGVIISDLHIVKKLDGPTEKMLEIERAMHKYFSDYKINFPVKFSGSNEFFYYRPEVFDMVEEAYKEIVC
ncbi:TPA: hypothetical protein ACGSG5_000520 [Escherichia coli]